MRYLLITLLFIYVSCGTPNDEIGSSDTTAADFETSSELEYDEDGDFFRIPRCTRAKDEVLIYLRYEEIMLVCRDKQWHFFDDPEDPDESCPITKPLADDEDEKGDDDDTDNEEV